ncbi:plasmid mobilization relaxosome protein MobC [Ruminococcus sp.]|uniref:plasmid mobilization protein n=1 Tax=Ruminococcus sp. TaxID=41978 RepID=UPI002584A002|nr:plasmid mobilization relaxosome protein MobC [Ruminococcus sp.]MCR5021146.1 plasmid mobilization relaxosome protein MobC [Ruminococcus sp.]
MARKYKQVKEKKVTFDMKEWAEVERRAAECHTKTGTYIRHIAVHGEMIFFDMEKVVPVLNGMRIISHNINQVTKKANETNSIYAADVDKMKSEVAELSHILTGYLSTIQPVKLS